MRVIIQPTFEKQYLKSNESKHCLQRNPFKRVFDKLSSDIQVDRLCTCGSLVIDVCEIIKVCGIIRIIEELLEKSCFSIFPRLKGLKSKKLSGKRLKNYFGRILDYLSLNIGLTSVFRNFNALYFFLVSLREHK